MKVYEVTWTLPSDNSGAMAILSSLNQRNDRYRMFGSREAAETLQKKLNDAATVLGIYVPVKVEEKELEE